MGTRTRTDMAAPSQPHQATYDAIVIGAGIQGSFTAYHLAQRHRDTLLLEQTWIPSAWHGVELTHFILPHSRGSSHGQSRITRSAYPQVPYARMMPDSFRLWKQLEEEAGTSLYRGKARGGQRMEGELMQLVGHRRTGLVVLGPAGDPELESCRQSLGDNHVLDAVELAQHFPGLRLHAGEVALWDSTGGVLLADRALRAVQNTPDGDFILDRHPKYSNIIIGAGFSGHGFKLAPVVGKLLCELSLGEEPSHSTAPFAISRFPGVLRAAL
ncbi:peroxisomal sarcosine oxidase-like protein [Amazona aestiva]|uniref:Peroxisomal sarcosine oxidase-like protein n=1 Tax=Amazona aestiva TaxID=12930 RepID=A0A0Q3TKP0_AMAAE|nr:peroxisomal sarcosine oxidase-like protein [Amazona aestiva]